MVNRVFGRWFRRFFVMFAVLVCYQQFTSRYTTHASTGLKVTHQQYRLVGSASRVSFALHYLPLYMIYIYIDYDFA